MAIAPQKKPTVAPVKALPAQPDPPDVPDVQMPAAEMDADLSSLYEVFRTETIAPPPVKMLGRPGGISKTQYPFDKLEKINQFFLLPPFPVDQVARKKEKQRISSSVYKKRKDGKKFKMIEIDQDFATRVGKPELVGRYGVWRVE